MKPEAVMMRTVACRAWPWLAGIGLLLFLPVAALLTVSLLLPPVDLERALDRSTVVLDRDGKLLRPFVTAGGRWKLPVTSQDVDPRYLAMLVAYEDKRFYSHHGIDPLALARAGSQLLRNGRKLSGGSTLTMQVARLAEPRGSRNLSAKFRQMARALQLECNFSKTEILDLYVALAPFGGNLEGTRAASLAWLGKEPKRLSTAESAFLVALPQAPELRRPDRFAEAARRARQRVLARTGQSGLVTADEATAAMAEPVPHMRHPFPNLSPHLAEQMVAERREARAHRLTLDAHLQRNLEQLARERSIALGPNLSMAILVVNNVTGEVRASVGGVDYFADERAGAIDLTRALRSPGSAMKPLIYALAFDNGIAHPETMLEDRPTRYGLYAPENFDLSFQGMVSARKALQMSLNVPTVELLSHLGPQRFLSRLRESGVSIALPKDSAPGLALGLGGLGITLQDITRLYAGLARGGEVLPLTYRMGEAKEERRAPRLVDPVAAWYIADVLLGAPPPLNASPGRIAFKTGTSYGYRDAWALGFDRTHTIGVWVGRADNGSAPGLVGRAVAAPILFDAFARIGLDPRPFERPADAVTATNGTLPPPMRHLRADAPKTSAAMNTASLRIAFPPDGARIDMATSRDDGSGNPVLGLKAAGGSPPFIWMVNGAPVLAPQSRRTSAWTPDGAGFVRISVIDGQGSSDSVQVRLQ
jgi:penicillin-binding protein 1C